jgi:nucleoid DNA-binding protein
VEKIIKHIEKLLAHYDYVIVPDFGGFVVQHESSHLQDKKITPPMATIGFNPLIQHSDGLLAIEIARSEGVPYRKAMEIIHAEVEKYILQLSANSSSEFGELGSFRKNETNILIFEPIKKATFLPVNLGLNDVYLPVINTDSNISRTISFTLPTYKTFRNVAAVFLILIGLFVFSPQLNKLQRAQTASIFSFNDIVNQQDEVKILETKDCPELKETTNADGTISNNDAELHHVIVASLSNKQMAEDYCKTLLDEEFECSHVLNHAKIFRVAIKSFSEMNEAIQYMEDLRKSDPKFETAWVLCK